MSQRDEWTVGSGDSLRMGEYLFRLGLVATPLSVLLMIGSILLFGAIVQGVSLSEWIEALLSPLAFALLWFFIVASLVGALIALSVVIVVGIPVWVVLIRNRAPTRGQATMIGAAVGTIVVVAELLFLGFGPTGSGNGSLFGLAFLEENGSPTAITWTKLFFDLGCTIGIGALSGRLAWREPR
jgi:hypothetical protein